MSETHHPAQSRQAETHVAETHVADTHAAQSYPAGTHGAEVEPAGDPVPDPGLPPHRPRLTDVDPKAADRAERQIATMFGLSALATVGLVVGYLAVPKDAIIANMSASNVVIGAGLGIALLLIGLGAIQWSKRLMDDHEIIEERHPIGSPPQDREDAIAIIKQGGSESGLGRRRLLRGSLLGALGVLGIPPIILLGDLGPLPGNALSHTIWRRGVRVVNDVDYTPLRPEDLELGSLVNGAPESMAKLEGTELQVARAKAPVILVRMRPDEIHAYPSRKHWTVGGIICYSKICPHVGCPTNLYEQQTHHLLCPCHQSTFDLADNGKVLFGPAARNLPQLPIMVDAEGYLVAQSDFTEPVGPSFWERG